MSVSPEDPSREAGPFPAPPRPHAGWGVPPAPGEGSSPPMTPPAPVRRRRGRRFYVVTGTIGLVMTLIVGAVAWVAWPHDDDRKNRAPFEQAVTALAAAQGIRYAGSLNGSVRWEMRVAAGGEAAGQFTVFGNRMEFMTVGGKMYVKSPLGSLPGMSGRPAAAAYKDKWVTGGPSSCLASIAGQGMTPAALAGQLRGELAATKKIAPPGKTAYTINGVSALKAATPHLDLYVSKAKPHRVLRQVPARAGSVKVPALPNLPSLPSPPARPSFPSLPAQPNGFHGAFTPGVAPARFDAASPAIVLGGGRVAPGPAGTGETDLSPMSPPDVAGLYDDLISNAGRLTDAVDASINFSLKGSATLNCSGGGCRVGVVVNGDATSSDPKAKVVGGRANAVLTATINVEGRPAGGCTSRGTLSVPGTGSMSCTSPSAGAAWQQSFAQARARAQAQARATPGVRIPYGVSAHGMAYVHAVAAVNVQKLVGDLQDKKRQIEYSTGQNSFDPGTPVLMADGSTKPIEKVNVGDQVLASDPKTGKAQGQMVDLLITGEGLKKLVTLTVDTDGTHGRATGEVTATGNHPFWVPADDQWVQAERLEPGTGLRTSAGSRVQLTAVEHHTASDQRVHNI